MSAQSPREAGEVQESLTHGVTPEAPTLEPGPTPPDHSLLSDAEGETPGQLQNMDPPHQHSPPPNPPPQNPQQNPPQNPPPPGQLSVFGTFASAMTQSDLKTTTGDDKHRSKEELMSWGALLGLPSGGVGGAVKDTDEVPGQVATPPTSPRLGTATLNFMGAFAAPQGQEGGPAPPDSAHDVLREAHRKADTGISEERLSTMGTDDEARRCGATADRARPCGSAADSGLLGVGFGPAADGQLSHAKTSGSTDLPGSFDPIYGFSNMPAGTRGRSRRSRRAPGGVSAGCSSARPAGGGHWVAERAGGALPGGGSSSERDALRSSMCGAKSSPKESSFKEFNPEKFNPEKFNLEEFNSKASPKESSPGLCHVQQAPIETAGTTTGGDAGER
eukprot:TRINITY_DN13462_c0_g1_i2.p2 TRINITY_DN13462_c0_g1~~TRINITY_DN13462_c0_g1_i2.p2  ORF type:complete len:422 (+),score=107.61 TRINITY_DN13462_c0_g1_i2:101-1267(+)